MRDSNRESLFEWDWPCSNVCFSILIEDWSKLFVKSFKQTYF